MFYHDEWKRFQKDRNGLKFQNWERVSDFRNSRPVGLMAYAQKALNVSLNKWLISTLEKKVLVDQKLRVKHAAW